MVARRRRTRGDRANRDRSDGDEPIPPPSLPDRGSGRDRAGPIRRPRAPRARGGGSQLGGAAGNDRRDAAERIDELITLLRRLGAGGRSTKRADAASRCRSRQWRSRSQDAGRRSSASGARRRPRAAVGGPRLRPRPHRRRRALGRRRATHMGASRGPGRRGPRASTGDRRLRRPQRVEGIAHFVGRRRRALGSGARRARPRGASNAVSLVPDHVLDDILVPDPDPKALGARARSIGATDMAVPAFSIESVPDRVAWARSVLAAR